MKINKICVIKIDNAFFGEEMLFFTFFLQKHFSYFHLKIFFLNQNKIFKNKKLK